MSERPLLLDLFCCAGGAAMGYHRVGFDVVGVDLAPQPNYPFDFRPGDALEFLADHGDDFDVIHASPPCQKFSSMTACRPGLAEKYPDLVAATRAALDELGKPYAIENVPRSPVRPDLMLCGLMFGRELYRHRLFESNVPLAQPLHPRHVKPASKAGHWTPGTVMSISGHVAPVAMARDLMDMHWTSREELAEAIPPYYAEHVGASLLAALNQEAAA